ncbi:glutamate synthase, subunit beta [Sulfurimonas gotlandica GD1]|uniref:Glutamate synthase, subunit beta n=1 Tax=Sulfurimonas gotlandica (strain DSM 19862 / JCM 16533 / GD1) TaxID=929558 RepID=B6BNP6_SULGG|nr:glutamate synthase subunit beta [Sulfurimonas gotlandica]EDZ61217.1 NADH-glutamate synthase small chain [Sulfurimonas gotlandica GD1]EHP28849.1 glutamate synthase, subunit beta [Sulfurimonas gotlandica GD1]
MGKVTGFREYKRQNFSLAPAHERIKHNNEFVTPPSKPELETQAARCMDCGIPFCHSNYGCPVGNLIPQFNDQIYKGEWESAFRSLMSTNNFPEFTGRVCPATCETACVLGMNDDAVSIKGIEYSIIEKAYEEGWMKAQMPKVCTGKKVAVVGSGPAGLSVANQLNKAGHAVTVYERDKRIGGLVRYGIPNFKLDKVKVVQRRVDIMAEEGVEFITEAHIGVDIPLKTLRNEYDAVVLCGGASLPRDLPIENRDANNIHFAMEFLSQCNSRIEGEEIPKEKEILATGKHVVVIGGGDTGSDCVGNSVRQGAESIIQIELMSKAPLERTDAMPWPLYPRVFKLSSSQEEGCTLDYDILSKSFIKDDAGNVTGINCVKIEWGDKGFNEIEGSDFILKADVIFLAMGFLGPEQTGMIEELSLDTDPRSNIATNHYATSAEGIFSAGDMRRGQSLVVWAIHEGRECAIAVDEFLSKKPTLLNARSKSLYEKR